MNQWEFVAESLKQLRDEVRSLKKRFGDQDLEEETSLGAPVIQTAFGTPTAGGGQGAAQNQFVCIVSSVDVPNRTAYVARAMPTLSTVVGTPWAQAPGTQSLLAVKVPASVSVPAPGDTVLITGTGLNDAGVVYGLFGASGGTQQVRLISVDDDYLVCKTLDNSLNLGSEELRVAKSYKLRRSPFDGETLNGLTFNYTSSVQRTVTTTLGSSQTQYVIPAYRAGTDILYITTSMTSVEDDLGDFCKYIDLNTDGRGWAST